MPPQQTDPTVAPVPVEPVQSAPLPSPVLPSQPAEVIQQRVVVQENLPPTTLPPVEDTGTYTPQAPQIMFEGETPIQQIQSTGMMQWIIANSGGAIKNEKQALNTLIGIIGVAIVISIYAIFFTGPSSNIEPPPIMDDSFVPLNEGQDL